MSLPKGEIECKNAQTFSNYVQLSDKHTIYSDKID